MQSEDFRPLRECPFCGGEAIVVKTERCGRYIRCWDCGGRTEEFETDYAGSAHDKAIAAWNCRAKPESEPLTNAQRIRGMTDEELAEWILRSVNCDKENIMCIPALYKNSDKCDGRCRDGRLSWLQQPAETEGTE